MRRLLLSVFAALALAACHTQMPPSPPANLAAAPVVQIDKPTSYNGRDGLSLGLDATQGRPEFRFAGGNPFAEGWTKMPPEATPPATDGYENNTFGNVVFVTRVIARDRAAPAVAVAFSEKIASDEVLTSDLSVLDDGRRAEFGIVTTDGLVYGFVVVRTYEAVPEYAVRIFGVGTFFMEEAQRELVRAVAGRAEYVRVPVR